MTAGTRGTCKAQLAREHKDGISMNPKLGCTFCRALSNPFPAPWALPVHTVCRTTATCRSSRGWSILLLTLLVPGLVVWEEGAVHGEGELLHGGLDLAQLGCLLCGTASRARSRCSLTSSSSAFVASNSAFARSRASRSAAHPSSRGSGENSITRKTF